MIEDELSEAATLYVGVDGGGSTCRVRLRDSAGGLRGEATGGAANVYLDFNGAVATIASTAGAALDDAGLSPSRDAVRLGAGLAGVSSPAVARRVEVALREALPGVAISVTNDADIACRGAHAGEDGGLVIAGTGSGAVARLGERLINIGGRGFILGDDGSGARLGLEGLRLALRAHDDLAPRTPLTGRLMARFHDDPVEAIAWGRLARSSDYAALAPIIIAAAAEGDDGGLALVAEAVDALAGLVAALDRLGARRLSLVGGLADVLRPFFFPAIAARFSPVRLDALDGALLLAGCPLVPSAWSEL